jgi:hypothetical protein
MTSWNSDEKKGRGIYWPATVGILLGQILVLLALGAVVVRYLEWSSDTNQAEFISVTKPSPPDGTHRSPSEAPVERVKGRAACYYRKAHGIEP